MLAGQGCPNCVAGDHSAQVVQREGIFGLGVTKIAGTGILYRSTHREDVLKCGIGSDLGFHSITDGIVHGHLIALVVIFEGIGGVDGGYVVGIDIFNRVCPSHVPYKINIFFQI